MQGYSTPSSIKFALAPSLPGLVLRYSRYTRSVFHRHTHDAYSIGSVLEGCTDFHLVQGGEEIIPVECGDLVLINLDEVHACNPPNGCAFAYFMLYIDPSVFMNVISDIYGIQNHAYRFSFPLIKNPDVPGRYYRLCTAIMRKGSRLEIETRLHETMTPILNTFIHFQPQDQYSPTIDCKLESAHKFLQDHLEENISLYDLSQYCHLSSYHFLRLFRRKYGLPPHAFQLQMRINLARRLLTKGDSISSIASSTGFADQSHFTRIFKRSVGATPIEYQSSIHQSGI